MLTQAFKISAATTLAMLKVSFSQLKILSARSAHEKIAAAVGHLEQCIAEIEDALQETR